MRALQRCKSSWLVFCSPLPLTDFPVALAAVMQSERMELYHSFIHYCVFHSSSVATEEPDLIGDFSRPFVLPLIPGKHQDLKCITPKTLVDLIEGKFQNQVEQFTIVDCRFDWPFLFPLL